MLFVYYFERKEANSVARVKTKTQSNSDTKPMRPALNPEMREQQLISLAVDLVEQRLRDGTASAQETTHFLKLASRKAKLEADRAETELELMRAKIQSIRDQADLKLLYKDAIEAMKRYSGNSQSDEEKENYDEY